MEKINDMQRDNMSIKSLKNKQKPKLRITGWKDLATLLGPNANKKYTLSPNQKSFQLKGRLTIAAIATVLAVGGASIVSNHSNNVPANNIEETQVTLEKDKLLKEANEKLFDIVYGENRDYDDYFVDYGYIPDTNSDCVIVGRQFDLHRHELEYKTEVKYTFRDNDSNRDTSEEIKNLMINMIEVYHKDNPSQKDLEKLNDTLEALDDKDFKLEGKNIVEVDERDQDYER